MSSVFRQSAGGLTASQAEMQLQTQRRRGEQRILQVVESLTSAVTSDQLCASSRILRATDYAEVIVERNCQDLCGYPLCTKTLPPVAHSLVFDVSRLAMRDKSMDHRFCTAFHGRASRFFQLQLLDTPVWSREPEDLAHIELLIAGNEEQCIRSWIERKESVAKVPSRLGFIDAGLFEVKERHAMDDGEDQIKTPITSTDGLDKSAHGMIEGFSSRASVETGTKYYRAK